MEYIVTVAKASITEREMFPSTRVKSARCLTIENSLLVAEQQSYGAGSLNGFFA